MVAPGMDTWRLTAPNDAHIASPREESKVMAVLMIKSDRVWSRNALIDALSTHADTIDRRRLD